MADSNSLIQIILQLVDDASTQMAEVSSTIAEGLDDITGTAAETAESFDDSMLSMEQSISQLNLMMQQDNAEIIESMAGVVANGIGEAASLEEANASIIASQAEVSGAVAATDSSTANSISSMRGNFIQLGILAATVFVPLYDATSDAISNAETWNETSAVTAQILKDTGSSIPVTQVQNFADSLSNQVLYTNEAILKSSSLVLSHKDLQSSYQSLVGLSADLATRMTTDLPSATETLTTALADPVIGMRALQKSLGVDFTATQVTAIENMAKLGNNAGADKVLLQAVADQIGGAAKAADQASDTGFTKLGQQMLIVSQNIGQALAPAVQDLFNIISPLVTEIANWINKHPQLTADILLVTLAVAGLVVAIAGLGFLFFTLGPAIDALEAVFYVFATAVGSATAIVIALLALIAAEVYIIVTNWTGAMQELGLLWDILLDTLGTDWDKIKLMFDTALLDVQTGWHNAWTSVSNDFQIIWNGIITFIKTAIDDLIKPINTLISGLDSIKISIPAVVIAGKQITPALNLPSLNIPEIPMLAAGALVTGPTLAVLGEAGSEAVLPLSALNSQGGIPGVGGGNGNNPVINIVINNGNFTTESAVRQQFNKMTRILNANIKLRTT